MKYLSPFLAAVLLVFGINAASAQSWPDKQVKIIVAYPAGGGVDPVAIKQVVAVRSALILLPNRQQMG